MTPKEMKMAGPARMGKKTMKMPAKTMTPAMASKIRKKAEAVMAGKGSSAGAAY